MPGIAHCRIALLLGLLLAGLASCACPAEARLLAERPDFRTPEAAGRSFLAAVSCDDAEAEYRCASEALKAELGATFDLWLIGRAELRDEVGELLLSRASSLDFLGVRVSEMGLLTLWGRGEEPLLGLWMVEQHYFDLYDDRGPVLGELLDQPPGGYLKQVGTRLVLEISDALPKRFPGFDEVRKFELGSEWKLRGLESFDSAR